MVGNITKICHKSIGMLKDGVIKPGPRDDIVEDDEVVVGEDNVGDDTDVEDDNDVGGEDGGEDLAE